MWSHNEWHQQLQLLACAGSINFVEESVPTRVPEKDGNHFFKLNRYTQSNTLLSN